MTPPLTLLRRWSTSSTSTSTSKELRTPKTASKTDERLGALQLALEAAQSIGSLSTIPFAAEVAGLALTLLGSVQATRDNKSAFRQLVFDACSFSAAVMKTLETFEYDKDKLPPRFNDAVKELLGALEQIKTCAEKQAKRGVTKRYIFSIADKAKVADCERSYQSALSTFRTLSAISTWANTEVLREDKKAPARASTVPIAPQNNFSVTDRSRGHTYVTGAGGVITQSTGLRVIMPAHQRTVADKKWTDSVNYSSPISESPIYPWGNVDVIDQSQGHTYDTSRGGGINLQQGATFMQSY